MTNAWKAALQFAMRNAELANPAEAGDYSEGDILYCGKCKTPKQCYITLSGEQIKVACMCKCKEQAVADAEKQKRELTRQAKIQANKENCFNSPEWARARFADDDSPDSECSRMLRNYANNFEAFRKGNKGLTLFGGVGTGKSFGAACIANQLLDEGYAVHMTNFSHIANKAMATFEKQAVYDDICDCDLLIIDDFAAERKTEYMNEIVYEIINSRYIDGRPLIVTTNLTADELKHPSDTNMQRVCSRLLEMTIPVEISGADRRKTILKNDYQDYMSILKRKE